MIESVELSGQKKCQGAFKILKRRIINESHKLPLAETFKTIISKLEKNNGTAKKFQLPVKLINR